MKKKKMMKKIIDLLRAKYEVHSIYLLGSRKEKVSQNLYLKPVVSSSKSYYTFLLFIIFRDNEKLNDKKVQKFVAKNSQTEYRIYPIVYTLSEFLQEIDSGSTFLCHIQANFTSLYKKDRYITDLKFEPSYYLIFWKKKKSIWQTRSKRACFLLLKLEEYDDCDIDSVAKLSMIYNCLQQLCLGLLVVCWNFKPKSLNLKYLLYLCSYYITLLKEPENSRLTLNAYHLILDAHQIMQQDTEIQVREEESEKAAALCGNFFREAHEIAEKELNHYQQKCLNYEKSR